MKQIGERQESSRLSQTFFKKLVLVGLDSSRTFHFAHPLKTAKIIKQYGWSCPLITSILHCWTKLQKRSSFILYCLSLRKQDLGSTTTVLQVLQKFPLIQGVKLQVPETVLHEALFRWKLCCDRHIRNHKHHWLLNKLVRLKTEEMYKLTSGKPNILSGVFPSNTKRKTIHHWSLPIWAVQRYYWWGGRKAGEISRDWPTITRALLLFCGSAN